MMMRPTKPTLLIGHDLLVLGLAALLRERGVRAIVRGGERHDLEGILGGPAPGVIIVDLLIARRDDFALLRRLRAGAQFAEVPILVLSSGTIGKERAALESRLRSLGARPLLSPHDLDDVLSELGQSLVSVA